MIKSSNLLYQKVKPVVVYAIVTFDSVHKTVKFSNAHNGEHFLSQTMKNEMADNFKIGQYVTIAYFEEEK